MSYLATAHICECRDCGNRHVIAVSSAPPRCAFPGCTDLRVNGGPGCRRHNNGAGRKAIRESRRENQR